MGSIRVPGLRSHPPATPGCALLLPNSPCMPADSILRTTQWPEQCLAQTFAHTGSRYGLHHVLHHPHSLLCILEGGDPGAQTQHIAVIGTPGADCIFHIPHHGRVHPLELVGDDGYALCAEEVEALLVEGDRWRLLFDAQQPHTPVSKLCPQTELILPITVSHSAHLAPGTAQDCSVGETLATGPVDGLAGLVSGLVIGR